MKSKTLQLLNYYQRLVEQDEQNMLPPDQGDPTQENPEDGMPSSPEPDTIPLSSQGEIRYIEDVVLAALMEPRPTGNDRITLENFLDLLKKPDAIDRIQSSGKTAKDLYQNEILPIIRPAQQGQEVRDISDQMAK
jgi:hypothetical protein